MKYSFPNTLQKGSFRRIIFKEGKLWNAVALEFNLVVSANDPKVAAIELYEAVTGYLEAVKKSKSRPFALNQKVVDEYEDMWRVLSQNKKVKSPYTVFDFGISNTENLVK